MAISILTGQALLDMRESCKMAGECLVDVSHIVKPGISTEDINGFVHQWILDRKAYPSPLNYNGFPKSVCTSINDVVCHGIPSSKDVLKDGDIVNIDVTTYFKKCHGDTSATFYVGTPSPEAIRVVEVSRNALELAIAVIKPDARVGDIGKAIQAYAEPRECSVVRDYVGHGIGHLFHTDPQIPHYYAKDFNRRIMPGMIFTIEPMINLGTYACEQMDDGWTVRTKDRKLSAQFEHTLRVTESGVEVLTARDKPLANSENLYTIQ